MNTKQYMEYIRAGLNNPESLVNLLMVQSIPSLRKGGNFHESLIIFSNIHRLYAVVSVKKDATKVGYYDAIKEVEFLDEEKDEVRLLSLCTKDAIVYESFYGRKFIKEIVKIEDNIATLSHKHFEVVIRNGVMFERNVRIEDFMAFDISKRTNKNINETIDAQLRKHIRSLRNKNASSSVYIGTVDDVYLDYEPTPKELHQLNTQLLDSDIIGDVVAEYFHAEMFNEFKRTSPLDALARLLHRSRFSLTVKA